jgi:hypothetical protein
LPMKTAQEGSGACTSSGVVGPCQPPASMRPYSHTLLTPAHSTRSDSARPPALSDPPRW